MTAEQDGEDDGRERWPHGFDQLLKGISAENDFLRQRGHGQNEQIDDEDSELARNSPESDDQTTAQDQGQDAGQQHGPTQRGA